MNYPDSQLCQVPGYLIPAIQDPNCPGIQSFRVHFVQDSCRLRSQASIVPAYKEPTHPRSYSSEVPILWDTSLFDKTIQVNFALLLLVLELEIRRKAALWYSTLKAPYKERFMISYEQNIGRASFRSMTITRVIVITASDPTCNRLYSLSSRRG